MRTVSEINAKLLEIENMIAERKKEGRRVGGGQYTIAHVLRWVLEKEDRW